MMNNYWIINKWLKTNFGKAEAVLLKKKLTKDYFNIYLTASELANCYIKKLFKYYSVVNGKTISFFYIKI